VSIVIQCDRCRAQVPAKLDSENNIVEVIPQHWEKVGTGCIICEKCAIDFHDFMSSTKTKKEAM
jgi:hypothetical protein